MRTVYRPLNSKILVVFLVLPATFFQILVARVRARASSRPSRFSRPSNRIGDLTKMQKMGGDTRSEAGKNVLRKKRMWTCPNDMYAPLGEREGGSTSPNKLFVFAIKARI